MFDTQLSVFAYWGNKVILVLLILVSISSVGLFVERLRFFNRAFLKKARELAARLSDAQGLSEVRDLLAAHPSVETELVARALDGAADADEFRHRVEGRAHVEREEWQRFTGLFAWFSANGPLAGLLGTILGLMKAFSDLAMAEVPEPSVALAGIADALLTTVLGILVAIPATAFFNVCKIRSRKAGATIEALTAVVLSRNILPRAERARQPERTLEEDAA